MLMQSLRSTEPRFFSDVFSLLLCRSDFIVAAELLCLTSSSRNVRNKTIFFTYYQSGGQLTVHGCNKFVVTSVHLVQDGSTQRHAYDRTARGDFSRSIVTKLKKTFCVGEP